MRTLDRLAPGGLVGRLARSVGSQVGWRVGALLLSFVNIGLVARYLETGLYGELAASAALFGVFAVLADFGVNSIVLRRSNAGDADLIALVRASLGLTSLYVAPVIVAFLFVGHSAYAGASFELLRQSLPFYAVGLLATCFSSSLRPLYQQQIRLGWVVASEFVVAAVCLTGYLVVIHFEVAAIWMFATQAMTPLVQLALLVAGQRAMRLRPIVDFRQAWSLLRESLPVGLASLVAQLYLRVDILIMGFILPASAVGEYGLANRVIASVSVISVYVGATLYPQLARLRGQNQRYADAFSRSVIGTLAIAAPLAAGIALTAESTVVLLGGHDFQAAAGPLGVLAFVLIPVFINNLLGNALVVANRARAFMGMSMLCLVVNVCGNLYMIDTLGTAGAALTTLGTELMTLVIAGWWLRADVKSWVWGAAVRILLATAAMSTGVLACGDALPLWGEVAVGATTYALTLLLLRVPGLPGGAKPAGDIGTPPEGM